MSAPSSDTIRQLAAKAQVLGLPQHPNLSESTRHLLQQADQERRLLSSSEIQSLCQHSGVMTAPLEQLQGQAHQLVDQARQDLLEAKPHLVKPGGALYPEHRAEACWRDCFHFLRVCCYAVAVAQPPVAASSAGEDGAALRQEQRVLATGRDLHDAPPLQACDERRHGLHLRVAVAQR